MNMAFSMTTPQMYAHTKDVTRRLGWANLKAGDIVTAVVKGMGLKKGEKIQVIGPIEILSVRSEPLYEITPDDVLREGFPEYNTEEFIAFFCKGHHCDRYQVVKRIEFKPLYPKVAA